MTNFLEIQAADLESWADTNDARNLLPALVRRLAHTASNNAQVTCSDFPAGDNAQKHGWDGWLEADSDNAWIPGGRSGWELSCRKDVTTKANEDYKQRTETISEADRKSATFVFVTPRKWTAKKAWAEQKNKAGEWKDVRAYDSGDLEQWLEQSVPGKVWLAGKLGRPRAGCRTLEEYWASWSETARPPISRKIFGASISLHRKKIKDWYQAPTGTPLVVTATSKEEALAFIACAARAIEDLTPLCQQAVLVDDTETLVHLAASSTEVVPVVYTGPVQKVLAPLLSTRRCLVVAEKGMRGREPDITVDLPGHDSWRGALTEMGFDDAEQELHTNRSGKSPTVLRRLLARLPEDKKPGWATGPNAEDRIQAMVPLAFAGTWRPSRPSDPEDRPDDQEFLRALAGPNKAYENILRQLGTLADMEDAPVWNEGDYQGVVSQLDCLYAVANRVTEADLDRFFFVAEYALGEDDPSLDLDREQRWMANVLGKARAHSDVLRESLGDTLVILAAHGDGLFGERLRVECRVSELVRALLDGQDEAGWFTQRKDLPRYAEAAPAVFLEIVEEELKRETPAFSSLFEPVAADGTSECERTGMLWALELLAWSPKWLPCAARALAGLCRRYEIDDNWSNKPFHSLQNVFQGGLPQTAASIEKRCDVLELVWNEYPEVAWRLCLEEIKSVYTQSTYMYTHRPRWRDYAAGAGQGVTCGEWGCFVDKCRELLLSWRDYTPETLYGLVESLSELDEGQRAKAEHAFRDWLATSPPDEAVMRLRERVRMRTFTETAKERIAEVAPPGHTDGKALYDLLEPDDVLLRHRWLFAEQHVEQSPDDLFGRREGAPFKEWEKKITDKRVAALREVLAARGVDGILELCLQGNAGYVIGHLLVRYILDEKQTQACLKRCLSEDPPENGQRLEHCIAGILHAPEDGKGSVPLERLESLFTDREDDLARVISLAPFERRTWDFVESRTEPVRRTYWAKTMGLQGKRSDEDVNFLVERLLEASRPCAAFNATALEFDRVDSARLVRILDELATAPEPDAPMPQDYYIEQAFRSLDGRGDVKRRELARLEYLYIRRLDPWVRHGGYGIPNLSAEIAESPDLFLYLLMQSWRRQDDRNDADEWSIPDGFPAGETWHRHALEALENVDVIPGIQADGSIDPQKLRAWVDEARRLAEEHGRARGGDEMIGKILSTCGDGEDGVWPSEVVRDLMQEINSKEMASGLFVRRCNSLKGRGMQPVNITEDRALADHYKKDADTIRSKHPFVARVLDSLSNWYKTIADDMEGERRARRRIEN